MYAITFVLVCTLYVCIDVTCACMRYVYRHVRSVYLETAVSARESKFIDSPDSSIHPSLLCTGISVLSHGKIELESPLNIQCRSTQYLSILFGVRMKYRRINRTKFSVLNFNNLYVQYFRRMRIISLEEQTTFARTRVPL